MAADRRRQWRWGYKIRCIHYLRLNCGFGILSVRKVCYGNIWNLVRALLGFRETTWRGCYFGVEAICAWEESCIRPITPGLWIGSRSSQRSPPTTCEDYLTLLHTYTHTHHSSSVKFLIDSIMLTPCHIFASFLFRIFCTYNVIWLILTFS